MNSDVAGRGRDLNGAGLSDRTTALRIVFVARRFIMKHLVGFVQGFHFAFRTATVRVTLMGQPLIKALDLARRSIFARAEQRIVIFTRVESIQSGTAL